MKRTLIVFLLMMLTRIMTFSSNTSTSIEQDSIVLVKASDLKYANLIFVEHDKLLKENPLLHDQIHNYIQVNQQLEQIDSLRLEQIVEYDRLSKAYVDRIEKLNTEIRKKNQAMRYWQIGGITVSVGLVLFLLLK